MFKAFTRALGRKVSDLLTAAPAAEEPLTEEALMEDDEEEAVLPDPVPAQVIDVSHEFDPIRMADVTAITFRLADGGEVTLPVVGEGGSRVIPGDRGMLAYHARILVSFEKESGEIIGGMYYIPAEEVSADE